MQASPASHSKKASAGRWPGLPLRCVYLPLLRGAFGAFLRGGGLDLCGFDLCGFVDSDDLGALWARDSPLGDSPFLDSPPEDAFLAGGVKERKPSFELPRFAAGVDGPRASLGDMAGA